MFRNFFSNFFLTNETRYINSDFNLGSSSFFNKLAITNISHSHLNIAIFFLTIFFLTIFFLPMFPNHGKSGEPNWEHNLLNKHIVAMLTLRMGILILKSTIPIYEWLQTHMALVMGVVMFLVNMERISKKSS